MEAKRKTGLEWLTFPFILEANAKRYPEKEAIVDSDFLISTEIAEALFSRPGRITPGQKSF